MTKKIKMRKYKKNKVGKAAFAKHKHILTNIKFCSLCEQGIFPVMSCGSQTWTLSEQLINKFGVTESYMEREMLDIERGTNV